MSERFVADVPERVLALLRRRLPGWKRKTLEQRLASGCVRVNGASVTRNDPLAPGDEVLLTDPAQAAAARPEVHGLPVLYADDALIAVDKPAGLLAVSTERETERTALALVRERAVAARPRRAAVARAPHRPRDLRRPAARALARDAARRAGALERGAQAVPGARRRPAGARRGRDRSAAVSRSAA
jgi:hypothetical protein